MIHIEALATDHSATELASAWIKVDPADVAMIPKGVRLDAWRTARIEFRTNGVNGGVNETGIKRIKMLLKAADKGIGVVFAQPCFVKDELNAPMWEQGMRYLTRAELESLMGVTA